VLRQAGGDGYKACTTMLQGLERFAPGVGAFVKELVWGGWNTLSGAGSGSSHGKAAAM